MKEQIHRILFDSIQKYDSIYTAEDILRTFQKESMLLYETHTVQTLLQSDPFQEFGNRYDEIAEKEDSNDDVGEVEDDDSNKSRHQQKHSAVRSAVDNFSSNVQVIDCHRVVTLDGYSFITATVQIPQQLLLPQNIQLNKFNNDFESCKDTITASSTEYNDIPSILKKQTCEDSPHTSDNHCNAMTSFVQLHFRYERKQINVCENYLTNNTHRKKTKKINQANSLQNSVSIETDKQDDKLQPADDDSSQGILSVSTSSSYTVQYTIDFSVNYGPKQKLLWVQVFSTTGIPSRNMRNLIQDDDNDANSDHSNISDDKRNFYDQEDNCDNCCINSVYVEENVVITETKGEVFGGEKSKKRPRTQDTKEPNSSLHQDNSEKNGPKQNYCTANSTTVDDDGYIAGIDPDVLDLFVKNTGLSSSLDELTATFVLLTFPFYEQEWEIVNYVLESVFDIHPGAISGSDEIK